MNTQLREDIMSQHTNAALIKKVENDFPCSDFSNE